VTITNKRTGIATLAGTSKIDRLKIPAFPSRTLPESMQPDWKGIITYMHDRGLWAPEKASLVEGYLINLHAMRSAKTAMDEAGGPIGEEGPHPASPIIARHSAAAAKIAALIGIGKAGQEQQAVEAPKSLWKA
jgi:hypothetical protein